MKAILEFNLPEEQEDYDMAFCGHDYWCSLYDFSQYLRNKIKYEELDEKTTKIYDQIRSEFYEILKEKGIEL